MGSQTKNTKIWSEVNRVGNSRYRYFYDVWSNIYFGFISANASFDISEINRGSGYAQAIDNPSGALKNFISGNGLFKDDPIDANAVKESYMVGKVINNPEIHHIVNVINRNLIFDFEPRFLGK